LVDHHLYLMFSDPLAGRAAEYNKWYDEVHLAEILSIPGYVAAQRFRRAPVQRPYAQREGYEPRHLYLTVYEIEDGIRQAVDNMALHTQTWANRLSPALNMETLMPWIYSQHGPRVTKSDFGF
jgi:hypothetical protein